MPHQITRKTTALALTLFLVLNVGLVRAQDRPSPSPQRADTSRDWSKALVDSTLTRQPDATKFGDWEYARSLFLFGQYLVYKRTHERRYLDYIKQWVDTHIDENGKLDRPIIRLDDILAANLLIILYNETGEAKYKKAADVFRHAFDDYPRTGDGGFWHATFPSRQHQLWLDGIFMGMPFLVRYGQTFGDATYANDEAVKQILVYYSHLKDPSGLLYHAYDETGAQPWADPAMHHSKYFWGRAMGWYGMATEDILDVLPKNHPDRGKLIKIVRDLVEGLARYQDPKTGLWYQVVDKGNDPNNWLETSCSSMFTYITDVAAKRGYVSKKYRTVADRGYRGVLSKVSVGEDGLVNISGISEGTSVSDLAYYYGRKRNVNDFHGLGAFLIMNEEYHTSLSSMQQTLHPAAASATAAESQAATVTSPNGQIALRVFVSGNRLRYSATMNGTTVLEPSDLAITVDGVNIGEGVKVGSKKTYSVNETFPWYGVHSTATDHSRGARIAVVPTATKTPYTVEVRAFDDGIAFRTIVPGATTKSRVPEEATTFTLPAGSTVWYHDFHGHYEGRHTRSAVEGVQAGQWVAPPLTFQLPGGKGYGSITEANLVNYSGMGLQAAGHNTFAARLGDAEPPSYPFTLRYGDAEAERLSHPAAINGEITTPWRVVMIGPDSERAGQQRHRRRPQSSSREKAIPQGHQHGLGAPWTRGVEVH